MELMKKKTILDYFPKKVALTPVAASIPKELFVRVRQIMIKHDLTWGELITACLQRFCDEMEKK